MQLNNLMDMTLKGSNGLLLFMIMVSDNYIGELLPCETQKVLSDNMWAKHIIGMATLLFFIGSSEKFHPTQTIIYSVILYIFFIITSRSGLQSNISLFIALVAIYILQMYRNYYEQQMRDNSDSANTDSANTDSANTNLRQQINTIDSYQRIILTITFTILVIGFVMYSREKYAEYSSEWNIQKFILGVPICKSRAV